MPNSDVTVVIPCYNAAPFVRETLESAVNQTHPPLEVIVVDDGSTDNSAAIGESFGPPVRVIRQHNQGESVARNRGMDEARGDWIGFLDADDIWKPEKLERQIKAAQGSDAVCVHTWYFDFGEWNGVPRVPRPQLDGQYGAYHVLVDEAVIPPTTALTRARLPVRFPTWTQYTEDVVFMAELRAHGDFIFVNEPLAGYRRHKANQSSKLGIEVKWHETIERYLQSSPRIDKDTSEAVRQRWLARLCRDVWRAKENRNWDLYWTLRDHLNNFRGYDNVDLILNNRIYPRWTYTLKDTTDALFLGGYCPRSNGVGSATDKMKHRV